MNRSIRTLSLAFGAAALFSGASASAAFALAPITVSVSGNSLIIDDSTGVGQALSVKQVGAGFEVEELNTNQELIQGAGVTATIWWSDQHQYFDVGSATINRVVVYGNGGSDLINTTGVTLPVTVIGGAGADLIRTGSGDDVINGGDDNDTIYGGSGADLINGGNGADNIKGENGDDQILGKDGYADTVDGGNDYDRFYRDAGLDTATNVEYYS